MLCSEVSVWFTNVILLICLSVADDFSYIVLRQNKRNDISELPLILSSTMQRQVMCHASNNCGGTHYLPTLMQGSSEEVHTRETMKVKRTSWHSMDFTGDLIYC